MRVSSHAKKPLPVSYKIRIAAYVVFLALLLVTYTAGIFTSLPKEEATKLYKAYKEYLSGILSNVSSVDELCYRIFYHNSRIVVACAMPGLGAVTALYTAYTSGMAVRVVAETEGENVLKTYYFMLTQPVMWLEMVAVSLVSVESIISILALARRNFDDEIGIYLATLLLAASILLFSASLEAGQLFVEVTSK